MTNDITPTSTASGVEPGQTTVEEKNTYEVSRTPTLYKFTNQKDSPYLDSILAMFYEACYLNRVGIMEAWNLETEQNEMVLVGIELDENGKPDCYPIASCLRAEDLPKYLAPDGDGGYYDPSNPSDVADFKDSAQPIEDDLSPKGQGPE